MLTNTTTLTHFLIEERRRHPDASGELNGLILDIALAAKAIARLVAHGSLGGNHGASGAVNVQGETQQVLDVRANDAFVTALQWGGELTGIVSEEIEEVLAIPDDRPRGKYLLACDPLDGSSNIDVDVTVGSLFSILRSPRPGEAATAEDFCQQGSAQVAAGYAIYGPCTMLVLTVGRGVHGFTLHPDLGEFVLTAPDMRIPEATAEFAINGSNQRFWEPAVQQYVAECVAGRSGPRGKDFNTRWVASMVADAHRILTRGGVFLYPRDSKDPTRAGRLRLLYEANPVAMLVEQAGGWASTGRGRVLDHTASEIHERIGLVFGAREEVARIEELHAVADAAAADGQQVGPGPRDMPFFGTRGLYRAV